MCHGQSCVMCHCLAINCLDLRYYAAVSTDAYLVCSAVMYTVMRVTAMHAVVSGRHLKVITTRKRKFFKTAPLLKRRDVSIVTEYKILPQSMGVDLCSTLGGRRTGPLAGGYGRGSPPTTMGVRGITPGKFWKFHNY